MILQQEYFQYVTTDTDMDNDAKSRLYYIEAEEYFSNKIFCNFSIILPVDGLLSYKVDNKKKSLQAGQCLLTYKELSSFTIDSPMPMRCICVDIEKHIFEKALKILGGSGNTGGLKADHFFSSDFFEYIYTEKDACIMKQLKTLAQDTLLGNTIVSDETFVQIAVDVIKLEFDQHKRLANLSALQIQTKKELLQRLLKGKKFIDDNCLDSPGIPVIAEHAQLSDFYFFRNFKSAFKESPYQYMIGKRLEHAKQLILEGINFTDVASECGFNDLPTFSKAFKRRFQMTPMQFKYPSASKNRSKS